LFNFIVKILVYAEPPLKGSSLIHRYIHFSL
jgi:hypothetical protein